MNEIMYFLMFVSFITVGSSLFVMKTQSKTDYSLMGISYGLFFMFILYWKSGNGKVDKFAMCMLFVAIIANSFHHFMKRFAWDFIFEMMNPNVAKVTYKYALANTFAGMYGLGEVVLLKKEIFDEAIRFELNMIHPVTMDWHYIVDYDADVEVFSGEVKFIYQGGTEITMKAGDFMILRQKEIHILETAKDTIFKFTCRKV